MVFSRASCPAFTITTNGETGILQVVQKDFLCLSGAVALPACLQPLSRVYPPAPVGLFLASMPLLDMGYPHMNQ